MGICCSFFSFSFFFLKRKQLKENNSHLWICLSGAGLRGKVSIQAGRNQWLASDWSVWRLPFPPLPLSHSLFVFLTPSLSLPYRRLPSLPSPPLPSARLPAAYKHTAHFCLAARRLACSLEPAAERPRGPETRMWLAANLFVCFGSLVSLSSSSVCVCVCLCSCVSESIDRVRSSRDECWMCFKYLLNHTRSSARVCVYETRHIAAYKCTHIDSRPLILWFCYAMPEQCMFHCGSCVDKCVGPCLCYVWGRWGRRASERAGAVTIVLGNWVILFSAFNSIVSCDREENFFFVLSILHFVFYFQTSSVTEWQPKPCWIKKNSSHSSSSRWSTKPTKVPRSENYKYQKIFFLIFFFAAALLNI